MRLDPKHYLKHSKIQMTVAAEVIEMISFKGDEKVLDIGCGDGKITALLHDLAQSAVGVDLSQDMVNFAASVFPHITFLQQSAEDINYQTEFDVLTCFSTLQWVRKPAQALERMALALKPGGKAYILTYPQESIFWRPTQMTSLEPMFAPYRSSAVSVHFSERYLKLAQEAGFQIIFSEVKDHIGTYNDLDEVKAYIQGWFPCYITLPVDLQNHFIDLVVQRQMDQAIDQGDGKVHLPYSKLVMVLQKPDDSSLF